MTLLDNLENTEDSTLTSVYPVRSYYLTGQGQDPYKRSTGQALVEFVIIMPILIIFWIGYMNLSSMYVLKQKFAVATRYGAWLAKDDIPCEVAKIKMTEYISKSKFVDLSKALVDVKPAGISVFYKTFQNEATVDYYFHVYPQYFPPYLLREKFALSAGAWQVNDITNRKQYYKDQMIKGDFNIETFNKTEQT